LRGLHAVVDEVIEPEKSESAEKATMYVYDISEINFTRLGQEFGTSNKKRTTV